MSDWTCVYWKGGAYRSICLSLPLPFPCLPHRPCSEMAALFGHGPPHNSSSLLHQVPCCLDEAHHSPTPLSPLPAQLSSRLTKRHSVLPRPPPLLPLPPLSPSLQVRQ